jgi:hypothetical protein
MRGVVAEGLRRAGFVDSSILLHWDEIAGQETARLARPVRLSSGPSGGTLTLKAEPGASLFLQHESRALTERINAYLGTPAVARIRFIQGAIPARDVIPPLKGSVAEIAPQDPVRRFNGPEAVGEALLRLAQARRP